MASREFLACHFYFHPPRKWSLIPLQDCCHFRRRSILRGFVGTLKAAFHRSREGLTWGPLISVQKGLAERWSVYNAALSMVEEVYFVPGKEAAAE